MPTYEYQCSKGHVFEAFQKMSDPPLDRCTECGSPAHRVVSGGAGFLFKGEGFYITDYRSEDYKKKAEREAGPSSKKDSKSSGKGSGGSAEKTSTSSDTSSKAESSSSGSESSSSSSSSTGSEG